MAEIRTPPVTGIKDSEQVPGTLKPTVIKNPVAYFSRMIQNLNKNEYRANDNFYNHVSSIGDGGDLQREYMKSKSEISAGAEHQCHRAADWRGQRGKLAIAHG